MSWKKAVRLALILLVAGLSLAGNLSARAADSLHFLVPGGAGGGWDATARGVGMGLRQSGLIETASFENVSGAGGGRAIGTLIESAARNQDVLMVNSTPIIVRSLGGAFPFSWRDLTPIARVIGDYQTLVVRPDSDLSNFDDILRRFREDPNRLMQEVCRLDAPGDTDIIKYIQKLI